MNERGNYRNRKRAASQCAIVGRAFHRTVLIVIRGRAINIVMVALDIHHLGAVGHCVRSARCFSCLKHAAALQAQACYDNGKCRQGYDEFPDHSALLTRLQILVSLVSTSIKPWPGKHVVTPGIELKPALVFGYQRHQLRHRHRHYGSKSRQKPWCHFPNRHAVPSAAFAEGHKMGRPQTFRV